VDERIEDERDLEAVTALGFDLGQESGGTKRSNSRRGRSRPGLRTAAAPPPLGSKRQKHDGPRTQPVLQRLCDQQPVERVAVERWQASEVWHHPFFDRQAGNPVCIPLLRQIVGWRSWKRKLAETPLAAGRSPRLESGQRSQRGSPGASSSSSLR
jgi:hypothetical protein